MEYIVNAEDENHLTYGDKYERLIRCKDCQWYEKPKAKIFENCCRNDYLIPMTPNDYCSYGERRSNRREEVNGFKSVGQAWNTSQRRWEK